MGIEKEIAQALSVASKERPEKVKDKDETLLTLIKHRDPEVQTLAARTLVHISGKYPSNARSIYIQLPQSFSHENPHLKDLWDNFIENIDTDARDVPSSTEKTMAESSKGSQEKKTTATTSEVPAQERASQSPVVGLLESESIFKNKEALRPSYTAGELPHREEQIESTAKILVTTLQGETPPNTLISGTTGTGKTASAKFVGEELESTCQKYEVPGEVKYINCEVTDTQYRVLAQLANKFIEKNEQVIEKRIGELENLRGRAREDPNVLADSEWDSVEAIKAEIEDKRTNAESFEPVPMAGWPIDRVYSTFFDAVDYHERVVVIMLDEIDKLVEKSGDDTLYNLSRMNSELENSRVSIIGISNDLKFTDFLDPRVKSSLGEEASRPRTRSSSTAWSR